MRDVPLSEQLGALARVDQLRHQQNEVDQYLSLPQRRAEVAARIREYYRSNAIEFSDAQVDQGVREFFASRLVFEAPPLGMFDRLLSKVLLKRSLAIRVLQCIAVAALMVQCARVIAQDSPARQAPAALHSLSQNPGSQA